MVIGLGCGLEYEQVVEFRSYCSAKLMFLTLFCQVNVSATKTPPEYDLVAVTVIKDLFHDLYKSLTHSTHDVCI